MKSSPNAKLRFTSIMILVALLMLSIDTADSQSKLLSLDKQQYRAGEKVTITVSGNYDETSLRIISHDKIYNYMNPPGSIPFLPKGEGAYRAEYYSKSMLLDSIDFLVESAGQPANVSNTAGNYIYLNKLSYDSGEEVQIYLDFIIAGKNLTLIIKAPDHEYKYLGIYKSPISFLPAQPGKYQIILQNEAGAMIQNIEFAVAEAEIAPVQIVPINNTQKENQSPSKVGQIPQAQGQREIKLNIHDRRGRLLDSDISIVKEEILQKRKFTFNIFSFLRTNQDRLNIEIRPKNNLIKSLRFEDLELADNLDLKLDEVDPAGIKIKETRIIKAYAVDPSNLSFNAGILTATAKGYILYKCKEFDFASQTCYGIWTKVQNIIPGEDYNISLSMSDPAFAEVGLASINTNKSIYHPYESVKLIMVVLDKNGFLVDNSDVTLIVTNPNGISEIFKTMDGSIQKTEKGIYEAVYDRTTILGEYQLAVEALGPDINNSMESYFTVSQNYPFDILRNTPVTTDPFSGPFFSEIQIFSNTGEILFNFTEMLPGDFQVVDAGSSSITISGGNIILAWEGLRSGDKVSYIVQPPQITPELYELNSYVAYGADIFRESRPWFLAIDPATNADYYALNYSISNTVNNPQEADGSPDNVNATFGLGDAQAAALNTYNFSVLPSNVYIYNASIMIKHRETSAVGNDQYCIRYSLGGTFYNLDGTAYSCANQVTRSTSTVTDRYNITSTFSWQNLSIIQFGVLGNKVSSDDGVTTFVDAIWLRAYFSWEPTPLSWNKNQSTIQQNETVTFNATWIDDEALSRWIFAINQTGVWSNRTVVSFTSTNVSNFSIKINATVGTKVEWRFYANDSHNIWNATPIQSFTVTSGPDTTKPAIFALNVSPKSGQANQLFNLSANITDNVGVNNAFAEITYPNGIATNLSMALLSGNIWNYSFRPSVGGNYSFIVYANDTSGNINVSSNRAYFNVTPFLVLDHYFYKRGDTVRISGYGYSANSTINLSVRNWLGQPVSGYPLNVTTNSTGGFNATWAISSAVTFYLGNYSVNANDYAYLYLTASKQLDVVVKPSSATLVDDNFPSGTDVTANLNDSDQNVQRIRSSQNEDYIQLAFPSMAPAGYDINVMDFTLEHLEATANTYYIDWLNSSTWQRVCTISPNTTNEINTTCNLLPYVNTAAAANSLSLRITEEGSVGNNVELTDIDFAFIHLNYSSSASTTIVINHPNDVQNTYTFADTTNNKAYGGSATSLPPASIFTGLEATSSEYTNLTADDSAYYTTTQTGSTSNHTYQSYRFTLSQAATTINSILITHNGRATATTSDTADSYTFYIWNYTSGAYQSIAAASASGTDQTTSITLAGNFSQLKDSSGYLYLLIEGSHINTGGPNAKSQIITDLMQLDVYTRKIISGIQEVNFTAVDADGVSMCYYQVRNDSLSVMTSWISMNNTIGNYWINYSDTTQFVDGNYYYYANCTDTLGNSNANTYSYVTISNAAPSLYLYIPVNYANFSVNFVNFTWNVTDPVGGSPLCNLSIKNAINQSGIISQSGQNTSVGVTNFADGRYNWSISCANNAGKTNNSELRNFTIDTTIPTLSLRWPANNSWTNNNDLTYTYLPYDANGLKNCSLQIDSLFSQQNLSILNNVNNTFNQSSQADSRHNWTVYCTDNFGWTNFSDTWYYYVDTTRPSINLISPSPAASLSNTSVQFNFTVIDNLAANFTCNLTVNNVVEDANFAVQNNSKMSRNLTIYDGFKYWNVTCWDNALNYNTSNTRNFSVSAPPLLQLQLPRNYTATSGINTNFTFYVADGDGIQNCSVYLDGQLNSTVYSSQITNIANNSILLNLSEDRPYNWTVTCFDNLSTQATTETRIVLSDKSIPKVILFSPLPNATFSSLIVNFNFTAVDNYILNLSCNLTVDNANKGSFNFANNTNKSVNVSLGDGYHYWNVTCVDNASLSNTSETRNFTIRGPPTVSLVNPQNYSWVVGKNTTFTYFVNDIDGIQNCSLYLDGTLNQTNFTSQITNGANNNFKIKNIAEGDHNWTVECFDVLNFGNSANAQIIRVDNFEPSIFLSEPINSTNLSQNLVNFNFTVLDAYSSLMSCNLSINSTIYTGKGNMAVLNNTINLANETLSEGRWYWNVTCADQAGNTNTSSLYTFFIDAGPYVNLTAPPDNSTVNGNFINFTYYVQDISGVNNCSLLLNGIQLRNETSIANFNYNDLNLSSVGEGIYNWSVKCYDTQANLGTSNLFNLTIDSTGPTVVAHYPNNILFNNNNIYFNFTATDNFDRFPTCNLSIDGTVEAVNLNATNNSVYNTTITGVPDGSHNWNVTCWDNALNLGQSSTLNFSIDAAPDVFLNLPLNGNATESSNVSFYYQVNDPALSNCSLVINNITNQTKPAAQIPYQGFNGDNNFTVSNFAEGEYYWTVYCTDINNFTGQSNDGLGNTETWLFGVDRFFPWVNLTYPAGGSNLSTSTINFNFTAFDSVDTNLTCNLVINGTVNQSGTWAINSVPRVISIPGFTSGRYFWNVSCWDNAFHMNTSSTWNFSVISTPSITLISPDNGSTVNSSTANLTFRADDAQGISTCDIFVDNTYQNTLVEGFDFTTGQTGSYIKNGLNEGQHSWYMNCTDIDVPFNWVLSTTNYFYVDLNAPSVTSHNPDNQQFATSTVRFNWTASDNIDNSLLCSVIVNSSSQASNVVSLNNTESNSTISGFTDGLFYWNVTCTDDAMRSNVSVTKNFTVQEPPTVSLITPANFTRTNILNQTFTFIPYDNSNNVSSCTVLLNLQSNNSNSLITVNVTNNISTSDMADGLYNWTINCTDRSGNSGYNASQKLLIIDLTGPNISLEFPQEGGTYNYEDINFTWNATDRWATNLRCNLSIDDSINVSNISAISGAFTNKTILNVAQGVHNYSVSCIDDLNNSANSILVNFTVNAPDLTLNNSHIKFNNTNPGLNETMTINATIYNVGGATASNIPVDFWDGMPDIGNYLGTRTISVLSAGTSGTVNVTWNISIGMHNIYIIINYSGVELNKSNNNATRNISVLYPAINFPMNNSWTNNSVNEFNFTISDYTGGIINYSVLVDGALNGQTGNSTDGVPSLLNITLPEGIHIVSIRATDYLGRQKDSAGIKIYVDQTPPKGRFETINDWWFNIPGPQIFFNITDNLDAVINYTFYVNDTSENYSTVLNGTSSNINLTEKTNGSYMLYLNSSDEALNQNSTRLRIFIDTVLPTISLLYPGQGQSFSSGNIELNFTVDDNLDPILACNLTLDSQVNRSNINAPRLQTINTTLSGLTEGTHYWNATCWDGGLSSNINNINTSETRNFNYFIAPVVTLLKPDDNNWSSVSNVTFFYNATDTTGIWNCSILINNQINQTNYTVFNGAINNFTVYNLDGVYNWSVDCFDNTSAKMYSRSTNRTINIDVLSPQPYIETFTGSWFNVPNPLIRFNITDNLDLNLNYTFYANGSLNKVGIAVNGTSTTDNLAALGNGTYLLELAAFDDAFNSRNSTPITIFIDTVKPSIVLNHPENGNSTTDTNILFNFTAFDNMANNFLCNLTVDSQIRQNFNVTSGFSNYTSLAMTAGQHYWNVTCLDLAGNINTSQTFNFTIPLPDLSISSSDIRFNSTLPEEGKNITINATIFNLGDTDATNFIIQFFDGNYNLSNQISNNFTYNLSAGSNITVNVSWAVSHIGDVSIYVVVDPPISANGSIKEVNESNNYAFTLITIGSYSVIYGNMTGLLDIKDLTNNTVYQWNITAYNSSKIYAVDFDSSVEWANLQAISRNISGSYVSNDFHDIDIALRMENNSDSINSSWSLNNNPRLTAQFEVFRQVIANVSIVNSTNTSNFMTGILWDMSDGNTQYNGSQDIVFLTTVNTNQQGKLGIYDYELKVPSNLKLYKGPNQATVSLYTELP